MAKEKTIVVRMAPKLYGKLLEYAEREEMSLSEAVRNILSITLTGIDRMLEGYSYYPREEQIRRIERAVEALKKDLERLKE